MYDNLKLSDRDFLGAVQLSNILNFRFLGFGAGHHRAQRAVKNLEKSEKNSP